MTRKCINNLNPFCYVPGSSTTEAQRHAIATDFQKLYKVYRVYTKEWRSLKR
jgi:hypothetical protein